MSRAFFLTVRIKKILYTRLTTLRLSVRNSSAQLTCGRERYCSASPAPSACLLKTSLYLPTNCLFVVVA